MLQRGYERGDLNLVYPLARGTGPLLTFVFAVLVLGDRPDAVAVAGVLAVIAGILLISLGGPRRPGSTRAGVAWGVATGVAIAAYTLWDDHAVNALDVPPLPYFALGLLLQLPALTLLLGRRRALLPTVWREARGPVIVVAVLSPMAYVLVLRALQLAPVSLVAPARETSIVVGALLRWWILREPSAARRLVGAAVVLAGIVGIVVGYGAQNTLSGRNCTLMRGPTGRLVLGTACSQVRWQEPPITIRSPWPRAWLTSMWPPRGRSWSLRGEPRETIATIVSWSRPRPMVSPCHATESWPSR